MIEAIASTVACRVSRTVGWWSGAILTGIDSNQSVKCERRPVCDGPGAAALSGVVVERAKFDAGCLATPGVEVCMRIRRAQNGDLGLATAEHSALRRAAEREIPAGATDADPERL
jgi:hypothetical protein